MFPTITTAFLSSLSNFLVFINREISTIFSKAIEIINPRTYERWWLPPPPPSLLKFFALLLLFFFFVDYKTSAPAVLSSCLFISRAHFSINPPPPCSLYHGGGTNLRVRPRVETIEKNVRIGLQCGDYLFQSAFTHLISELQYFNCTTCH